MTTMQAMTVSTNVSNLSIVILPPCDNLTDVDNSTSYGVTHFDDGNIISISTLEFWSKTPFNVTCLDHAPQLTYEMYRRAIILAIISIFSVMGNAATIYSVTKNQHRQHDWSAVYTLILHLSVADLLVSIICIGGEAIWSYTVAWIWGNVACKLFKFLQMFSLYLSTFILVLIGIDRFIAVRYPMKSLNMAHRCSRLILLAWIVSLVLAVPQIVIFHVVQGPFIEEFTQCVTYGFYTEAWQEQLYTTFSLFFMFLLPLAILITTYVSTIITIARSERKFKAELAGNNNLYRINGDLNRRRLMHRAKTKSLRISVVIFAAFILWWTPYYTMMIIFMFLNPDKHLSEELQSGIFFFGMSNSLVNPIIYGAFHLWPRRRRQKSCQRDGSSVQRRNASANGNGRNHREMITPFLSRGSTSSNVQEDRI